MGTTTYETHYDRYNKLNELYKIGYSDAVLYCVGAESYDVVVVKVGFGYAHTKYRVLVNKPNLSNEDLAIICDRGNLCFGYRANGSIISVYTD